MAPALEPPAELPANPEHAAFQVMWSFAEHGEERWKWRHSAMTAALARVGVPIVLADGSTMPGGGAGAVGLPHFHVAAVLATTADAWLPLQDVVRLTEQVLPPPHLLSPDDGEELRLWLTAALSSEVDSHRFLASLVSQVSDRLLGPSLYTAKHASEVRVDGPTIEVLLGTLAMAAVVPPERGVAQVALVERGASQSAAPGPDCRRDGVDGWAKWLHKKIVTGVYLGEGAQWRGPWREVLIRMAERGDLPSWPADAATGVAKSVEFASAVLSVAFVALSYMTLGAKVELAGTDRLERVRYRSARGGAFADLKVTIVTTLPVDEASLRAFNCLLALGASFGLSAALDLDGKRAGVAVTLTGRREFSSEVGPIVFGSNYRTTMVTDGNGEIRVNVLGLPRERSVPEDVPPRDVNASVHVKAALGKVTIGGVAQTIADAALCKLKPGWGCARAAANVIKGMRWNIGEFTFPIRDYVPQLWLVKLTLNNGEYLWSRPVQAAFVSCSDDPVGPWLAYSTALKGFDPAGIMDELLTDYLTSRLMVGTEDGPPDVVTMSGFESYVQITGEANPLATLSFVRYTSAERPEMKLQMWTYGDETEAPGKLDELLVEAETLKPTEEILALCARFAE